MTDLCMSFDGLLGVSCPGQGVAGFDGVRLCLTDVWPAAFGGRSGWRPMRDLPAAMTTARNSMCGGLLLVHSCVFVESRFHQFPNYHHYRSLSRYKKVSQPGNHTFFLVF